MNVIKSLRWSNTIWARGASDFIPERFRRIITVVMPIYYVLFILYGLFGAIFPLPTVASVIGPYGMTWATLVSLSAAQSLLGLIFKHRIEIYSSIVLTILLSIQPIFLAFIIIASHKHMSPSVLVVFPAVAFYPILPGWRVFDIVFEIRKARQRQLWANSDKS